MTVRVSVNYNDPRWKRCDLKRYVALLVSKVIQTHQMRLNESSLSVLACGDSKIKELNKKISYFNIGANWIDVGNNKQISIAEKLTFIK